jgi:hypothetical protein
MPHLLAVLALLAGLVSGAVQASIVTNGSFEDPFATPGTRNGGQVFGQLLGGPGTSWNVWDAIPGWTTGSGAGIEIQSDRTLGSIDAAQGSHYVELDSTANSSMFQRVLLGVGRYELSFAYSPRTRDAASNGIDYSVDGLLTGRIDGPDGASRVGVWTTVSRGLDVRTAGSYVLSFGATGRSDSYGGLIDSVAITPSAVPVPAALVLLATALGGLGVAARVLRAA